MEILKKIFSRERFIPSGVPQIVWRVNDASGLKKNPIYGHAQNIEASKQRGRAVLNILKATEILTEKTEN